AKVFTKEFFDKFDTGFRNYEAGEWEIAYSMLSVSEKLLASEGYVDGPSASLKRHMDRYDRNFLRSYHG
ncbi:hypothetical protein FOZ60_017365, partial [Perkinsus olseni]